MNGPDAAAETITGHGFRRSYEADAFDQFPLITPLKLSDEARDRGIQRASSFLEELERLDREGALRPVLFQVVDAEGAEAVVFRDEQDYVPWTEYAVPEWGRAVPQPRYSPWQLLYLNYAVELPNIPVSIEWLLDDERRATLDPNWRTVLSRQLERVERLQEEGVLTDETTFLWDTSFEEENFTDEELVAMIAAIGADRGAHPDARRHDVARPL